MDTTAFWASAWPWRSARYSGSSTKWRPGGDEPLVGSSAIPRTLPFAAHIATSHGSALTCVGDASSNVSRIKILSETTFLRLLRQLQSPYCWPACEIGQRQDDDAHEAKILAAQQAWTPVERYPGGTGGGPRAAKGNTRYSCHGRPCIVSIG